MLEVLAAGAHRTANRSYLQAARGEPTAEAGGMATYPGDPHARPELAVCVILATGAIKRKRDASINKTMVCWLNGNIHDSGTHHVVDALESQLHIDRRDFKVVKHFPEHHRGRTFHFDQWTERCGAVASKLEFRVRLRVEGVPVHAWSVPAILEFR